MSRYIDPLANLTPPVTQRRNKKMQSQVFAVCQAFPARLSGILGLRLTARTARFITQAKLISA